MKEKCPNLLKEKKGMALLFVLCALALLMALGVSMFFAAASTLASAAQSTSFKQASLSAESFCQMIQRELTKDSKLKEAADKLAVDDTLPLSAVLPDSMGEVDAVMTRASEKLAIVTVTAIHKKKKCNMSISFQREEDQVPIDPDAPEGDDEAEKPIIVWSVAKYSPNID